MTRTSAPSLTPDDASNRAVRSISGNGTIDDFANAAPSNPSRHESGVSPQIRESLAAAHQAEDIPQSTRCPSTASERSGTVSNTAARFKGIYFHDCRSIVHDHHEILSNVAQRSLRDDSPTPTYDYPNQSVNVQQQEHDDDEDDDAQSSGFHTVSASSIQQLPKDHPSTASYLPGERTNGIILQPETHPSTEDQLVHEVRALYSAVVIVEKNCIEIVKQQNETSEELTALQWQALTSLHRSLLHEHHDFFLASNHPAASIALKELAKKYSMSARMWRYGIHSFLELLRKKLPSSLEHMLTFIYMAYAMITLLLESAPTFEETWVECLGDLSRYRMAIEEVDMRDREIYTGVARHWYTKAADLNPDIGRIQHHLAVLGRPNQLQQLFYYSKALTSVQPFSNARESILLLFGPLFDPARAATKYSQYYPRILTVFVEIHGIMFTRRDISAFLILAKQFLSQLGRHAGIVGPLFREQGVYISAANYAAILDYGHDDASIPPMFDRMTLDKKSKTDILNDAYRYWEKPSCLQIAIARRTASPDSKLSDSGQVVSLASHFAFTTLDIILELVGDRNTLPSVHISLAFLWCVAMVPESMSYIQADVPWARVAYFLNTLITPETDMAAIENGEFPAQESGISRQLPEDFLIRGLSWSRWYYPSDFFDVVAEDDERAIEPPSVVVPRTRRCLWLGSRIAMLKCWLVYNPQDCKFAATSFAQDLAVLSRQYQVLRRGSGVHSDTDIAMAGT